MVAGDVQPSDSPVQEDKNCAMSTAVQSPAEEEGLPAGDAKVQQEVVPPARDAKVQQKVVSPVADAKVQHEVVPPTGDAKAEMPSEGRPTVV